MPPFLRVLLLVSFLLALGGADALAQRGKPRLDEDRTPAATPVEKPRAAPPRQAPPVAPRKAVPPPTAAPTKAKRIPVPDVTRLTRGEAQKALHAAGLRARFVGVGSHVQAQTPAARMVVFAGGHITLTLHTPAAEESPPPGRVPAASPVSPASRTGLRGPLPAPQGVERVEDWTLQIQSAGYLTLNGMVGQIELYPPAGAVLAWNVNGAAVSLRVNDAPFSAPCEDGPSQWNDADSVFQTGASGEYTLDLTSSTFTLGQTYYVMGCGWMFLGIGGMPPVITGATNVVSFQYGPVGASSIGSADILVADIDLGNISPGGVQGYPLELLLRNQGAAPTGTFDLAIQYRQQSVLATAFYNATAQASLEGNSELLLNTGIYLDREKDWQVTVTADSAEQVPETSEQNNQASGVVPQGYPYQPHIRNFRVRHNHQPDAYLTFKIKNQGGGPGNYRALVIIDHSQSIEFPVFGHPPGEERYFVVDSRQLPVGQHEAQVVAQNFAGQYVSNFVDKSYHKTTGVGGGSGSFDLKVKDVHKHQNNQPGCYITFKVKNIGGTSSTSYRLSYSYTELGPFSLGGSIGTITSGPQVVAESPAYPSLAPGAVRQHQLQSELEVGHYQLLINVNRLDGQPDSNPSNDVKYKNYHKTN